MFSRVRDDLILVRIVCLESGRRPSISPKGRSDSYIGNIHVERCYIGEYILEICYIGKAIGKVSGSELPIHQIKHGI